MCQVQCAPRFIPPPFKIKIFCMPVHNVPDAHFAHYDAVAYKDVSIREAVFFHRASKTLVVTDAVARIPYEVWVS